MLQHALMHEPVSEQIGVTVGSELRLVEGDGIATLAGPGMVNNIAKPGPSQSSVTTPMVSSLSP